MTPDINSLVLEEEVFEVPEGATADDFYKFDLVDDGKHVAVLKIGNKGVQDTKKRNKDTGAKDGAAMVLAHVQAVLVDDNGNETKQSLFSLENSAMIPSRGMSGIHAMLEMAGHKLPNRVSISSVNGQPSQMKTLVENALSQSPRVGIRTEWQASYKVETAEVAAKTGKKVGEYYTFLKGQKKFPPVLDENGNSTGKYNREATDPKTGCTGTAQPQIVEYFRA